MKQFWFGHYWWIILSLAVVSILSICVASPKDSGALVSGVAATAVSITFFTQQQKISEVRLFKELFTEFNHRYDKMNGDLEDLEAIHEELGSEHRKIIVDYFNMCAEEYLFRSRGYIPDEVWRSWCQGMLDYISVEPFRSIWNEEVAKGCYYGLSTEVVVAGAGVQARRYD